MKKTLVTIALLASTSVFAQNPFEAYLDLPLSSTSSYYPIIKKLHTDNSAYIPTIRDAASYEVGQTGNINFMLNNTEIKKATDKNPGQISQLIGVTNNTVYNPKTKQFETGNQGLDVLAKINAATSGNTYDGTVKINQVNAGDYVAGAQIEAYIDENGNKAIRQAVDKNGNPIGTSLIETGKTANTALSTANMANQKIIETNSRVTAVEGRITGLQTQMQNMDKRLSQGIAGAMAIGGMAPPPAGKDIAIGASVASYNGQSALAIGAVAKLSDNANARLSATTSGGVVAGVTFGF